MNKVFFLVAFFSINLISINILSGQLENDNWYVNIEEASINAKANQKNILMIFSGSDWCRPCMKFKQNVLTTDVFADYINENLIVLYLDFPAKKKNKLGKEQKQHNEKLAEMYNKQGSFSKIVLLNNSGDYLTDISYNGQSASDFISLLKTKMNIND